MFLFGQVDIPRFFGIVVILLMPCFTRNACAQEVRITNGKDTLVMLPQMSMPYAFFQNGLCACLGIRNIPAIY